MSLIAGNLLVVQKLLEQGGVVWGVAAGAAAHLYGNRRPIQDVDILVSAGQLPLVVKLLQQQQKAVQFDGQRILWRGIKFFDALATTPGQRISVLSFDAPMVERRRRMPLLGAPVAVLAPEDVLAHKIIANRGTEAQKHDAADAAGIVRRQQLDLEYLAHRLGVLKASPHAYDRLVGLGIAPLQTT